MVIQLRGYVVCMATVLSFEQLHWLSWFGLDLHASLTCQPTKEQRLASQLQIRYSVDSWGVNWLNTPSTKFSSVFNLYTPIFLFEAEFKFKQRNW